MYKIGYYKLNEKMESVKVYKYEFDKYEEALDFLISINRRSRTIHILWNTKIEK